MMCSLWGSYQHAIVGLHNMERNVSYASSAALNFFSCCYLFPLNSFCFPPPCKLCVCSLWVSGAVQLCPWLWLLRVTFLIILLSSLRLRFVGKANSQFPWKIWLHYFHCQGSERFSCSLVHSLQDEWYMGFSYLMTVNLDKAPLFYCLSH